MTCLVNYTKYCSIVHAKLLSNISTEGGAFALDDATDTAHTPKLCCNDLPPALFILPDYLQTHTRAHASHTPGSQPGQADGESSFSATDTRSVKNPNAANTINLLLPTYGL